MRFAVPLVVLMVAGPLAAADPPFFFQKGDRVVFLGDSITEQYQYSTDIELYLTTRFPGWGLSFLNAGMVSLPLMSNGITLCPRSSRV